MSLERWVASPRMVRPLVPLLVLFLAACGVACATSAPPAASGTRGSSALPAASGTPGSPEQGTTDGTSLNAVAAADAPRERPQHLCPCRVLAGTDGLQHDLVPRGGERLSVLVFYAHDCPVMQAHAARLRDWAARFAARGVRFYAVDSEISASLQRDQTAVTREGYPFPILLDPGAAIAQALDAEVASYAVVLDRAGNVQYAGGLDSDRANLSADATLYLPDALDDLLAGTPLRRATGKALGCALRTH
jgi:peroxiredoxin